MPPTRTRDRIETDLKEEEEEEAKWEELTDRRRCVFVTSGICFVFCFRRSSSRLTWLGGQQQQLLLLQLPLGTVVVVEVARCC